MSPNPYESPQNLSDEQSSNNLRIHRPGILSWFIVIVLLPTPLLGGVIGLVLGLVVAFQFFEKPPAPPLPDITETGRWVVVAFGALGFVITGTVAGFTIWRVLHPVDPA